MQQYFTHPFSKTVIPAWNIFVFFLLFISHPYATEVTDVCVCIHVYMRISHATQVTDELVGKQCCCLFVFLCTFWRFSAEEWSSWWKMSFFTSSDKFSSEQIIACKIIRHQTIRTIQRFCSCHAKIMSFLASLFSLFFLFVGLRFQSSMWPHSRCPEGHTGCQHHSNFVGIPGNQT